MLNGIAHLNELWHPNMRCKNFLTKIFRYSLWHHQRRIALGSTAFPIVLYSSVLSRARMTFCMSYTLGVTGEHPRLRWRQSRYIILLCNCPCWFTYVSSRFFLRFSSLRIVIGSRNITGICVHYLIPLMRWRCNTRWVHRRSLVSNVIVSCIKIRSRCKQLDVWIQCALLKRCLSI